MEIVELIEYKNGRVKVRLDNGLTFLLYKKEAVVLNLQEGEFLTDDMWWMIRQDILIKRARKRTMYLLQKKDYTEKQLREKLCQNEYPQEIIDDAIEYVSSFHYVDDERYAANYVHYHQRDKSVNQLKMELHQKGVSKEQIERAFEEELIVSQDEVINSLLKKKRYDPSMSDEKEKHRIYQYLMRKGFKSSDVLRCMNMDEFA